MAPHVCAEDRSWCRCDSAALEPSEECPVHSGGPWPPRCDTCGRLMPWPKPLALASRGGHRYE